MWLLRVICFCSGLYYGGVHAANLDDLKKDYMDIIMQCMNDNPLSPSEIEDMHKHKMPESQALKCLLACAFKKSGMMDDKGYLSAEGVQAVTKKYYSDDPDTLKKSEAFVNACKSVNDVAVSDGDKGCERASLVFKCSTEKAPDFHLVQ